MKITKSSSGISSQKSIKIDGELWDKLDSWLQTSDAKKLGFHSKADFATQSVREMLEKYSSEKQMYDKFIKLYNQKKNELKDVNNPLEFLQYLEHFKLTK